MTLLRPPPATHRHFDPVYERKTEPKIFTEGTDRYKKHIDEHRYKNLMDTPNGHQRSGESTASSSMNSNRKANGSTFDFNNPELVEMVACEDLYIKQKGSFVSQGTEDIGEEKIADKMGIHGVSPTKTKKEVERRSIDKIRYSASGVGGRKTKQGIEKGLLTDEADLFATEEDEEEVDKRGGICCGICITRRKVKKEEIK